MNLAHICVCFGSQDLLFRFINSKGNLSTKSSFLQVAQFCENYGFPKKSKLFRRLSTVGSKEDAIEQFLWVSTDYGHLDLTKYYPESLHAFMSLSFFGGISTWRASTVPPALVMREHLIPFAVESGSQAQLDDIADALQELYGMQSPSSSILIILQHCRHHDNMFPENPIF